MRGSIEETYKETLYSKERVQTKNDLIKKVFKKRCIKKLILGGQLTGQLANH